MASSNTRSSPAMSHSSTGAKSPAAQKSTLPLDSSRYASAMTDSDQPIELSGPDHKPAFPPKYTKRPPSYPNSSSQPPSTETYQSRDLGTGRLYYHNQGPDDHRPATQQQVLYTQPQQDYYRTQPPRQPVQPVPHQPAHYAVQDQYYHGGQAPQAAAPRTDDYYHAPSHGHAQAQAPQQQYYQERPQGEYYQPRQSLDQQQYYHAHARQAPQGGAQIKIEPADIDQLISRATPERQNIGGKGSRG
ncbi:hypothetical protein PEBR_30441 [Penicillium brasilianum]|uniref:Uncharacterized protein n=1 Tax=Penicillium brasilianum TaxID=104259 RepID=A0A1S9RFW0_PENBI|nr:hypothetical protein PEBR_30441 [Penicillium brasilianum]